METLEQTLRRLDQERDEADKRYNDALTALDRALPKPGDWPSPLPAADDSALAAINDAWDIAAVAPAPRPGWRGRLTGLIWRTVAPYLQRQASFNSLHRRPSESARHCRARWRINGRKTRRHALREEFARLAEFHSRTIQYLQQMTAYVDTRDRRAAGGAMVLNASLSGLAENVDKRWESLGVRDQRADARARALSDGQDELRAMLGVVQQASLSLKRELERLRSERGAKSRRESVGGGSSERSEKRSSVEVHDAVPHARQL